MKFLRILGKWALWTLLVLFCSWLLILICINPFSGHRIQAKGYETLSIGHMRQLALAVKTYEFDHVGKGPDQLADLVPKYMDSTSACLFESPYTTSVKPAENLTGMRELIEVFSPYVYVPLEKGRFVISERPGMWRSGMVGYVLSDDMPEQTRAGQILGHIVTIENFKQLLAGGFPKESGSGVMPAGNK